MARDYVKIDGTGTHYFLNGREVIEARYKEYYPTPEPISEGEPGTALCSWHKPILSDALAVHPKQIAEVMARNARHGLHVEYEPEHGRPILKDRNQRRELMRIERVHDNSGGYGDG